MGKAFRPGWKAAPGATVYRESALWSRGHLCPNPAVLVDAKSGSQGRAWAAAHPGEYFGVGYTYNAGQQHPVSCSSLSPAPNFAEQGERAWELRLEVQSLPRKRLNQTGKTGELGRWHFGALQEEGKKQAHHLACVLL